RGVTLSFASALLQAITAVLIVGVAAVLIGATAKAMGDTVRVIETVSYALIELVGARLFWVQGRAFLRTLRALDGKSLPGAQDYAHDHAAHAHHGPAACCHHNHAHHHHELGEGTGANTDQHHHEHGGHHGHSQGHEENVLPWGHAHGPEPEELAGP